MGNNKELLLVHASMKRVTLSQSVNVMLTPQFYTLKKEALPVHYAYQAKRIAPSLFDGLLEEVGVYDYLVYKEEDTWVFIAYNLGQIRSLLLSKGIDPDNVSKIFFAEQAISSFSAPMLLGDKEALVTLNNTVTVIPQAALGEETSTLTIDDSFTPKNGVTLMYGSILNMNQTIVLSMIFTIFAGMFFVEGGHYSANSQILEDEMQVLSEEYPSLQSQYTRKSVAVKYKTIDSDERRKRVVIKSLASMIFKGVTLTSFVLNEKDFRVQFACIDTKVVNRLTELAKKEKFKSLKIADGNTVQMEGAL